MSGAGTRGTDGETTILLPNQMSEGTDNLLIIISYNRNFDRNQLKLVDPYNGLQTF